MDGTIKVSFPAVSLKIVVSVHFILTIWGNQIFWLPVTYLLCNLLVLAVGVWAIASTENEDASQLFLIGMLFTILQDIIVFSIYYTPVDSSHFRFCVGYKNGYLKFDFEGTPYATIDGQSSSHPPPGYAPGPAPGHPPQS